MSAINGILHFNDHPIKIEHGKILMEALQHYPADSIQTWCRENIMLGYHGQWITPESIGEHLPYWDYEKQLVITADAIIDNRDELFGRLQVSKGHRKNMPDSQLILLAYQMWGEETPKYLIGDFAFMIWDERNRKLFGARDFSGSRTLYFYNDIKRFAFCTTIEPLLKLPYVEKKLNEQWLAEFLAIPTVVEAVDMSLTVYKNIHQVPPCHSISVVNGRISVSKYGSVVTNEKLKFKSNEEYQEAFHEVFKTAVMARIRAFGNVGSHLSGGLDSGTVVSFAAQGLRKQNKVLHTYSFVPEDDFIDWTPYYYTADERPFIKETVKYVGNIKDYYLNFKGKNSLSEVDDFLELMEMPYKFFENTFWLKGIFEEARHHGVKILLNGARGNHSISWGSWNLTINYYCTLLKKLRWMRLYNELDEYCKHFRTGKSVMIPLVARKAFPSIAGMFANKEEENYQFPLLINPLFAQKTKVFQKLQDYGLDITGGNVAARNLNEYRKSHYEKPFFWNKSGAATTKLSLRYGLWDRDPTNDLRVIRFCLALPEEQYVQGGMERSFIRRATKNILPDKVRLNQRTRGIQSADVINRMAPNWDVFIDELKEISKDSLVSELLNVSVIKKAISKIEGEPRPEFVFTDEFKILARSIIVSRFIKSV
ncbi:asparagine synthase-related protein [Neobacillus niacini]|uniref:asparagine synthase-related protein n=1 Tax=Neobacillus niacini TaxID=86668 RepID=UPI003000BEA1